MANAAMNPGFEVSEPPSKGDRRGRPKLCDKLHEELDKVVELDGEWAKIASWPQANAANKGAHVLRHQRPDMEFTARATDDGGTVWARLRKAYK